MTEIHWSEKALLKFIRIQFTEVSKRSWISTWFQILINSKTGKKEWLHKWTEKQLESPDVDLILLANKLKGISYADTVMKIEKYVVNNYTYLKDSGEYWQKASETLKRKLGDCEDQNNLIYILCRLAGVPNWLLWNVVGGTANGYHFYCVYYYTPRQELIPIDSTYYVETGSMATQKPFRTSSKKYHIPDFIWNEKYTFKWKQ